MKYMQPSRVLLVLLLMDAGVGALHLLFLSDPEWGTMFNMAYEENFPTWYSSFLFLLGAGAGWFCYIVENNSSRKKPWGWLVVALGMLGLAMDEILQIHESLIDLIMNGSAGDNLRQYFGVTQDTDSLLWTVVFAPVIILAGTALIMFYYSRLHKNLALFRFSILPSGLLVLSAGLEFMEAKTLNSFSQDSLARYWQFIFIEEMLEFVAASLFIWIHYKYAMWQKIES